MKARQASRTAEYNALFRAVETAKGPKHRVVEDQLAERFLSQPLRSIAGLLLFSGFAGVVSAYIDFRQPGARPSVVARTRLIDDYVIAALRDGISQIAILGAGFDTRAYRIAGIEHARIFEVDHPNTSAVKRERIRHVLGALPANVSYVTLDFADDSLGDALAHAGFDLKCRTLFIWEGVTNYLTEDAVISTLGFVGTAPVGSRVVFTYIHRDILCNPDQFPGGNRLHRRLSRLEERMTFGLDPAEVPRFVAARGLRLLDDVGSVEYRGRFLGTSGAHLRGHEFYRVAVAEVSRAKVVQST
jgi:methyltransferase (TIGR00027 family)